MMRQKKNKKIFVYFFLIIILSSINNIELGKIKFNKIDTINVSGLNFVENEILKNNIKKLNLENIFSLNSKKISKLFNENTLIENYVIFKKYPSTLDILVEKTKFLAQINIDGQLFMIGSNGKLTQKKTSKKNLPYIFGKMDIGEFLLFKKMIDQSKIKFNEIKSFYFFPSMRWDLELKNNILIKLPKDNIRYSLDAAYEFVNNNKNFEDLKIIDARIMNQIILND